jgi:CRP-like cAMP-binding protein
MSSNVLVRKLEGFHPLSKEDQELLDRYSQPVVDFEARRDIIREGDVPANVSLILSGFACRYKIIGRGRRQIMAYLVPGDFCDFQVFILDRMDHSIGTLSRCEVVELPRQSILELTEQPAIARAFWWASLVDAAVLREWLVNLGQRPAQERIAHLLCELLVRLEAVGLVADNSFALPITQLDLADTVGMTNVHANRMLTNLREQDLIEIHSRELFIKDVEGLMEFSGFDSRYLHKNRGWSEMEM